MGYFVIIELLVYVVLAAGFGLVYATSKKMRMYIKMRATPIIITVLIYALVRLAIWGLMSLELWHQEFHDREHHYKKLLQEDTLP